MEPAAVVAKMAPMFMANQRQCGILASVSMAQFILESGYGKSELAQNANNCFGMKASLSGNTWSGSAWDGHSVYSMKTGEQNTDGSYEIQKSYFTELLSNNPDEELVKVYADEGSGRSTQRRPEFRQMIQDCVDGKIDVI